MDKTEARARIASLHAELRKLEEIVNAPEALLNGEGWCVGSSTDGFSAYESHKHSTVDGNNFPTEGLAAHYAKAINTLLLLRHQPGTVKPRELVGQYFIRLDRSGFHPNVMVSRFTGVGAKVTQISPCFETQAAAETAINIIGKNDIIHMFKTLHGLNA